MTLRRPLFSALALSLPLVWACAQNPRRGGGDPPPPAADSGAPSPDAGGRDAWTPPMDTGTPPMDTGTPPMDTGTPPMDTGTPPMDTGTPPMDTGAMDTGAPAVEICGNGADDDDDGAADCADSDCAAAPACLTGPCSGLVTLDAATGVITDGSGAARYGNNMSCSWRITVPGATAIELDFTELDTESCCDQVTVYEGTGTTGRNLGRIAGTSLPGRLTAVGESMYITWTTDSGITANGFSAMYRARTVPLESCTNGVDDDGDGFEDCADDDCAWSEACVPVLCSGTVGRTAPDGILQDGSGPTASYVNNMNCAWRIQVPGASAIQLDFREMATEACCDHVTVYQGTSTAGVNLGRYNGTTLPPRLFAEGDSMYVTWTSDSSGTRAGWLAEYTTRTTPLEDCTNGADDDMDGAADCDDEDCDWDEACTPVLCMGTVDRSASAGTLQDGSGPSASYANNMNCAWRIQVPGASAIQLDFREMATEACCDHVTVYQGTSAAGVNLGRYNGTTLPPRLFAEGESMYVTWTSDSSGTRAGWLADYVARTSPIERCANGVDDDMDGSADCADGDCAWDEACTPVPCSGTVDRSAPTGTVQDGSGPSASYTNNMSCAWRIQVPGATSIALDFRELATESCCDKVTVYQGTSTAGTSLGQFGGSTLPGRVTATGDSMYVTFSSDSGIVGAGFLADYAAAF